MADAKILIEDTRKLIDFKNITFSKFEKNKVVTELLSCLINAKLEESLYWTAEMVCSGHFLDLWDTVLLFVAKHVHLGNPKLPIYILMRFNNFKEIIKNYDTDSLDVRNNEQLRQLFAEIICVLWQSKKKHSMDIVKLDSTDFGLSEITMKLRAPDTTYITDIFKQDDPKEIYIALNELAFHISPNSKNSISACYWLEWIIEFENINKKKRIKCLAHKRTFDGVSSDYDRDIIWIIWELILTKSTNSIHKKIINALLRLYSMHFSLVLKKKRRFIIYFAISILTDHVDLAVDIINDTNSINTVLSKNKNIYRDVKKNEISAERVEISISKPDKIEHAFNKLNGLIPGLK